MSSKQSAQEFLKYVNAAPSPYHVVEETRKLLLAANYREISEVRTLLFEHSEFRTIVLFRNRHGTYNREINFL